MLGNLTLKGSPAVWTQTGGTDVPLTQLAPGLFRDLSLAASIRNELEIKSNPQNDNTRSDYLIKLKLYADPVAAQPFGSKDNLLEVYNVIRVNWAFFTEAQVLNQLSVMTHILSQPSVTTKILKGDS